eukprot:TRINITY_DN2673_c0_g1_i1.p2 TRINITY_DN2673_c0_g1~~TRINITY_DN2673_c0_g1_i1.p2  ORF type:complete len:134 (+),score=18.50 TRINITY_DN2673_c0_g1_i1:502-903(+)
MDGIGEIKENINANDAIENIESGHRHRITEYINRGWILKPRTKVLVAGIVSRKRDRRYLMVSEDPNKLYPYIVTTKSSEEILSNYDQKVERSSLYTRFLTSTSGLLLLSGSLLLLKQYIEQESSNSNNKGKQN